MNKWFTAVRQALLEGSVARETYQKAFRVGCRAWREVKMVRIAARRVRSRHLLDKGLEARGRERVWGESGRKCRVLGLEGQVRGALPGMWVQGKAPHNSCLV